MVNSHLYPTIMVSITLLLRIFPHLIAIPTTHLWRCNLTFLVQSQTDIVISNQRQIAQECQFYGRLGSVSKIASKYLRVSKNWVLTSKLFIATRQVDLACVMSGSGQGKWVEETIMKCPNLQIHGGVNGVELVFLIVMRCTQLLRSVLGKSINNCIIKYLGLVYGTAISRLLQPLGTTWPPLCCRIHSCRTSAKSGWLLYSNWAKVKFQTFMNLARWP